MPPAGVQGLPKPSRRACSQTGLLFSDVRQAASAGAACRCRGAVALQRGGGCAAGHDGCLAQVDAHLRASKKKKKLKLHPSNPSWVD